MKPSIPTAEPRVARHPLRIVASEVGLLLVAIGAAMSVPLVVALLYAEWHTALAFLLAGLVTTACGGAAHRAYRDAAEPEQVHAMLIAAVGWLAVAAFGALPFVFAAYLTPYEVAQQFVPAGQDYVSSLQHFRSPLHALFESMSAYTTTGLTMSVREPSVGHGLLFYRSFAQWIGGAGVIVLALAILRTPRGIGSLSLYSSEAREARLRPSMRGTARAIWRVYLGVTLASAAYLTLATLFVLPDYGLAATFFDAVNHAMTGQSTGGFSTLDDSIAGYGSYAMDLVHIPPMVLGAISIPLYYRIFQERHIGLLWRDPQFRSLILLCAGGSVVLILLLAGTPAVSDAFREGLFQYVSAITTTGWQTSAIGDWEPAAVLFITFGAMVIGGSAGATVGGIKIIRAWLIARGIRWSIARVFLPRRAVVSLKVGGRSLGREEMHEELAEAALFTLLYLAVFSAGVIVTVLFMGPDFTLADAVFESATAQGTVGLSSGITGPSMSPVLEVLYIVQMWIGRLEIIPVMVLARTLFFGLKPKPYR